MGTMVRQFMAERVELTLVILLLAVMLSIFYPPAQQFMYLIVAVTLVVGLLLMVRSLGIIQQIPEYKRLVVFRMGQYYKTAGPGWVFLAPILDSGTEVELRDQVLDLPPQAVLTADEILLNVDTVVIYRISDPAKAVLKVTEFEKTLTQYVYGAVRDIASNLVLNELYGEIDKVNDIVKVKVEPFTAEWGISIKDVQITHLSVPEMIQTAMHQRRQAQEQWAAAQYQAKAQRVVIEALGDAAKSLDQKALTYLYLKEALPKLAEGKSTKIFFPLDLTRTPMVGLGGLGALAPIAGLAAEKLAEFPEEKKKEGKEEKEEGKEEEK